MTRAARSSERPLPPAARWGLPVLIVAAALLAFRPVLSNGFVNWDDPYYFQSNANYRGLTLAHLRWMFTTLYMSHYQPLSWLTHALVYAVWGLDPFGYHLGNLLLHAANGVALYFLIVALLHRVPSGPPPTLVRAQVAAGAGALFFVLHPLRVEVVAWATERQEVLCALFFLLSILAYLRVPEGWRWYVLSVICFAGSLLSKAAGIMLPVVLLILDVYPLRRLAAAERGQRAAVLIEKLPFVALSVAAAGLVYAAKSAHTMVAPLAEHGIVQRLAQAAYGLIFYIWKTVVPLALSPLYPLPHPLVPTQPIYVMAMLLVVSITAGLVLLRRRWPWALATWACYATIVFPVLGVVQAGPQIAADRYTYLASLPWSVLIAAGLAQPHVLWVHPQDRLRPAAMAGVTAVLLFLGVRTHVQSAVWHDSLTLWTHAVHTAPGDFAYHNRGQARHLAGDIDGALADYDQALRLAPERAKVYANRGMARQAKGDLDGALADFDQAIRLDPADPGAYSKRASARYAGGNAAGALADLDAALRLDPEYAEAYYNRANVRQLQGDAAGAMQDYDAAIRLRPGYAKAYANRGVLRQRHGDLPGAIADYRQALELTPPGASLRAAVEGKLAAAQRVLAERSNRP
jgi:Tfp pilus assembly protein PilF